jgi:GNAT superfamily N-acetyltransferase
VIVARLDGTFAGYVTVLWRSEYPPFAVAEMPEIADLNVLAPYRRRGIGTRLMQDAEAAVARSPRVGIAVGLDGDYGDAQRLYARRGYVPDGLGVASRNRVLKHGDVVVVDDDLVLHLVKTLR